MSRENDAYTVSDTNKGNGRLTYPVGLITADEVVAGSGKFNTANYSYYIYKNNTPSWTFSPYMILASFSKIFGINTAGNLNSTNVNNFILL